MVGMGVVHQLGNMSSAVRWSSPANIPQENIQIQIYAQCRDAGLKDAAIVGRHRGTPSQNMGIENCSEAMFGRKNGDVGQYCGLVGE